MTTPPPAIRGNPARMRDTLRYFLEAYRCAKVRVPGGAVAVASFHGGIAVGNLDGEDVQRFTSLEAALREFQVGEVSLGDLLGNPDCRIEPPEPEDS